MKFGIVSINEIRQDRGLAPVPWGEKPWLPLAWAPTDLPERTTDAPGSGRAKKSQDER